MESCEVCGDDLRHICSQGHASRTSALFCETCGEMLPLAGGMPAMAAAAPLTMDYSTGSFTDFIAGGDGDAPGPGLPSAVTPAEPVPEPEPALEAEQAPEAEPAPEVERVPEAKRVPEPEPGAPPAPDTAPLAPKPAPTPASKATATEPKATATEPKPALSAPKAVPPPAANGGTATTMPPDLRFTVSRDTPRTWRSSTKPRDEPGPDGGVHHDDGPRLAEEPGTATEPRPGRSRRFRVIAIVVVVAVLGAGGTVGAIALHRHYAARLTAPLSSSGAGASTTP